MEIKLLDKECKEKGNINLPDSILAEKVNRNFLYEIVKYYRANQRAGTSSTKTRAEVSGGGRKPWKQKHTGRARQGSIRSPIWKGGGVVFGPRPRDFSLDMPVKKLHLALKQVLKSRVSDNMVYVFDNLSFDTPKTKNFENIIKNLNLKGKKILVVMDRFEENTIKSLRNIEKVSYVTASNLSAYDLISNDVIFLNQSAIDIIKSRVEE